MVYIILCLISEGICWYYSNPQRKILNEYVSTRSGNPRGIKKFWGQENLKNSVNVQNLLFTSCELPAECSWELFIFLSQKCKMKEGQVTSLHSKRISIIEFCEAFWSNLFIVKVVEHAKQPFWKFQIPNPTHLFIRLRMDREVQLNHI